MNRLGHALTLGAGCLFAGAAGAHAPSAAGIEIVGATARPSGKSSWIRATARGASIERSASSSSLAA
jgi:hypothetical protein